MADLNALIAQGAQFNMPDQLGQYAKMQQLQAGQQQMRTGALQEQTAGMQLQKLKEDRANMAALSQKLSVRGVTPRQYFEALQTSGDPQHQQLGIEGLMKLDATEAFDRSQQTIPGQTPARVGGELGSGTAFMDNALPGMPAPANALATRAAAPAASTNALAPTPAAADPVTAIEAEMRRIQPFVSSGATGAKEAMARLEKKLELASKRYTVGDTLMGQSGNVFGTAPAKAAAPRMHVVNGNLVRDDGTVVFTAPKVAGDGTGVAKAPSGYRFTKSGDLEAIPGGPAAGTMEILPLKEIQKREAKYPQAITALKGFDTKTLKLERDIDDLITNKDGLNEITGFFAGRTDLSAMSKAGRRALSTFNTITAKGGFSELQDMRNASPTGGALGNVSNTEGQQLIASFGALARTQDADDLRRSLTTIKSDLQESKQRVKEAFDETYAYRENRNNAPAAPAAGALSPAEQAELAQLRKRFGK